MISSDQYDKRPDRFMLHLELLFSQTMSHKITTNDLCRVSWFLCGCNNHNKSDDAEYRHDVKSELHTEEPHLLPGKHLAMCKIASVGIGASLLIGDLLLVAALAKLKSKDATKIINGNLLKRPRCDTSERIEKISISRHGPSSHGFTP